MRKVKPKKENSERWLLTYSDLITLLMIFFVVMYAMSNVDARKYSQAAESFKGVFSGTSYVVGEGGSGNGTGTERGVSSGKVASNKMVPVEEASKTEKMQQDIKTYLNESNLDDRVKMSIEPRGLVIRFEDNVLFESGKADVLPAYKKDLLEIGKMAQTLENNIVVEGHTDNVPIHNGRFESNWELAAMRAINVIDMLVGEGGLKPEKLAAVSYGEYKPIKPNTSKEGREQNRRIDIIVLNSDFYKEDKNK